VFWEVNSESNSNVVAAQIGLLRRKLTNNGGANPNETLHSLGYRLNLGNNQSK
jgi:DNA-binding response OmpR family regulator